MANIIIRPSVERGPASLAALLSLLTLAHAAAYTPLTPLPAPRLGSHTVAYPGGHHDAQNLLDGKPGTEYSSDAKGTNTVVEFDFPAPVRLGAFRHVDRNDPATVAASELTFLNAAGQTVATQPVRHVNRRAGETFFVLPAPVTAQRVRWRITALGSRYSTVGGAEIEFFAAGDPEPTLARDTLAIKALPFLRQADATQPVRVTVSHRYAEMARAVLRVPGAEPKAVSLQPGQCTVEWNLPAVKSETTLPVTLEVNGALVAKADFRRQPVRPMTIYILPHSHTDIGYTAIQTDIEKRQVQNLIDGLAAARRTANYPEGARFVWNVEVLWAADLYLRRLDEKQRQEFFAAVKSGQVALCGMYLNELTGLCRPEELLRLFRFSTQLAEHCGVTIDSAMISDVPGCTWGTVTAMNHAGIKYFSTAPNYFDRIGDILVQWENKPFYWLGPDGKSKVLVWIPFWGYAMSHRYHQMSFQLVEDFFDGLEKKGYPYDVAHVRWSGHGDNAVPDPAICEFVKDWNAQYQWPKFIISSASEAFRALEQRYGSQLPVARGEWSPYWEDGAGSSAFETALNRASSDRLAQAETLYAMLNPRAYPAADFAEAWRYVLLYSEHTWGAWCSVSHPERKETLEQWAIKQGYALAADLRSRALWNAALAQRPGPPEAGALDVFNTLAWPRSELVLLPRELSAAGDRVTDDRGRAVPSQRLRTGELAVQMDDFAPLSGRRYHLAAGTAHTQGAAKVAGNVLDNGRIRVRVDETTGAIVELTVAGQKGNLVDTTGGEGLNDYLYLPGDDLKGLQRNGPVTIRPGEPGPLVASLVIESAAPGCLLLRREIRLAAGQDYVECLNFLDKTRIPGTDYRAKSAKESVNFAFPFNVPGGRMRLELPIGVADPEADLLPSACKNWFTVGRWADVSADHYGVTWVTLDAPLVQVGGITANLLNSQTNPDTWRKRVERTQKLYSWALNNHWGTNYRAYQDGPLWFRFILRPHRAFNAVEATRFATGWSHPLVAAPARGAAPSGQSLLQVEPADVLLLSLKPTDDGQGLISRFYGASGTAKNARLRPGAFKPASLHLSDTSEKPGALVGGAVNVPGYGVVTLRAEP